VFYLSNIVADDGKSKSATTNEDENMVDALHARCAE